MSDQEEFNQDVEPVQDPVAVPHRELVPETLRAVIESFVLREGTDYGAQELTLEQKVSRLMLQLDRGEAQIEHPEHHLCAGGARWPPCRISARRGRLSPAAFRCRAPLSPPAV